LTRFVGYLTLCDRETGDESCERKRYAKEPRANSASKSPLATETRRNRS
jgi:hypothetical protein